MGLTAVMIPDVERKNREEGTILAIIQHGDDWPAHNRLSKRARIYDPFDSDYAAALPSVAGEKCRWAFKHMRM